MTQLQIAEKLREQIKEQWPYVSTILALYANNTDGRFTERIQDMVDRLLPREVFYQKARCFVDQETTLRKVVLFGKEVNNSNDIVKYHIAYAEPILSLPINQVLFASEDNMFGHLK
jgi:hypothetical protein